MTGMVAYGLQKYVGDEGCCGAYAPTPVELTACLRWQHPNSRRLLGPGKLKCGSGNGCFVWAWKQRN